MAAQTVRKKRPRPRSSSVALIPIAVVAIYSASNLLCHNGHGVLKEFLPLEEGGPLLRRQLLTTLDESNLMETVDSESIRNAALNEEDEGEDGDQFESSSSSHVMTPYTLTDAINESKAWESTFAIVIYNPQTDKFIGHYSEQHKWKASAKKLWGSMNIFANILRREFPDRFTRERGEEMVFAIASGDYPHVKLSQLPYTHGVAPMLMFGSVFRDENIYPNIVAMPMPGTHLGCFDQWSKFKRVCGEFQSRHDKMPHGSLVFGDEFDLEWDDLVPQVIWRGTDFGYLPTLSRPKLSAPIKNNIEKFVEDRKLSHEGRQSKMMEATKALREKYDQLLPRWKGAVLSAEAELEVIRGKHDLPWADIKFSRHMQNGMMPNTIGSQRYKAYDEVGIATGNFMSSPELAKYKYQIDLGGGGGTTWTGTIEKLAMPGLLFHHITPTKDYIHDRMRPWVHYVPVSPDLRDLRHKFDWAENHNKQARRIADKATQLMRDLGTPEGFKQMFDEDFVDPIRQIIDAYQPVSLTHPGMSWKDVLESYPEGSRMVPIVECSGQTNNPASCRSVGGDTVKEWQRKGHYIGEIPVFVESNTN